MKKVSLLIVIIVMVICCGCSIALKAPLDAVITRIEPDGEPASNQSTIETVSSNFEEQEPRDSIIDKAEPTETVQAADPSTSDNTAPHTLLFSGMEEIKVFINSPNMGDDAFGQYITSKSYAFNGVSSKEDARRIIAMLEKIFIPVSEIYDDLSMVVFPDRQEIVITVGSIDTPSYSFLYSFSEMSDPYSYLEKVSETYELTKKECSGYNVDELYQVGSDDPFYVYYAIKDNVCFFIRAYRFDNDPIAAGCFDLDFRRINDLMPGAYCLVPKKYISHKEKNPLTTPKPYGILRFGN